jgi:hypothetical protein
MLKFALGVIVGVFGAILGSMLFASQIDDKDEFFDQARDFYKQ